MATELQAVRDKLDGSAKKHQPYDYSKYLPKDLDKKEASSPDKNKEEKKDSPAGVTIKTEKPLSPLLPPSSTTIISSPPSSTTPALCVKALTCASLMPPIPAQKYDHEEIMSQQLGHEIMISGTDEPLNKRRRVNDSNSPYVLFILFLFLFKCVSY